MTYIHSDDKVIDEFIQKNIKDRSSIKAVCEELFNWFDKNVKYSRLNAPFFPLQRSDLDVISMQAGTCGDYSNLLVSVFQKLEYEVKYAYIHKDCYGDEQDHICVAVRDNNKWILIEATLPYRKWHGFNCQHQEYELLSPDDFEDKMKKEESYWMSVANKYGNELLAGLLYAPWIHEEIIKQSDSVLESVFFLLILDEQKNKTIYAYYKKYTKESGTIPVMCIISNGTQKYRFSCKTSTNIWDNEQWSEEYLESDIPRKFNTDTLYEFKNCISNVLLDINKVLSDL
ncbi:transglutaminase domain-containing protein [Parvimonas sp. G1425]|uniref:transglutaminase domain-containing protein n=1 Tax=Parvimonas sp. G1425 TaxID=3387694 RepID=UPI0039E40CA9